MTKQEYINKIAEYAINVYPKKKILPSLVIAQCICESGWFKSALFTQAFNLTGMKYSNGCGTGKVRMRTSEQLASAKTVSQVSKMFSNTVDEICKLNNVDSKTTFAKGTYVKIYAYFRKYSSLEDGIEGHYKFLNYKRYKNLKGVTDYEKACKLVQQDGWATSVTYAATLISIIKANKLYEFDKKINGTSAAEKPVAVKPVTSKTTNAIKAGQSIKLSNCQLYASATATKKAGSKTGTFYIWNTTIKNGRIRITNNKKLVGKSSGVTGWIPVSAIK